MNYRILKNGEAINTIVADEAFVSAYCTSNGYTYQQIVGHDPDSEPTETEQLRADIDFIAAMTGVSL